MEDTELSWKEWLIQREYNNVCYTKYLDNWVGDAASWQTYWEPHVTYHVFQTEKCPTSDRLHFQGYMEFKKRPRHGAIKKLDKDMHFGSRYKRSSAVKCLNYCTKEETKVDGPWITGDISRPGARTDVSKQNRVYADALEATTLADALAIVKAGAPRDFCLHGESIRRNLTSALTPKFEHKYKMDDYIIPPKDFPSGKSLHFWGPSTYGKTNYALAHFVNPLLVTKMDTLKKINPDHDGLVFDEMTYHHLPIEEVKNILDVEHTRDIHARNVNATIPANLPRIICSQFEFPFYKPYDILDGDKEAVDVRKITYEFTQRIFVPNSTSRITSNK